MSSSGREEIRQLLALITTASEKAAAVYESSGHAIPSLKTDEEVKILANLDTLMTQIRILEGACTQLLAILTPPAITTVAMTQVHVDVACLNVVVNARVPDILYGRHEGVDITEIALRAKVHPTKLLKIMRNLASKHVFYEVAPNVFRHNSLSLTLRDDNGVGPLVDVRTNENLRYGTINLYNALVDPSYGPSPESNRSAFSYGIQDVMPDATYFDFQRKSPGYAERFNRAMKGMSEINGRSSLAHAYPWEGLSPGSKVCDIGSGIGLVTLEVAVAHPHLRFTLQDLPDVLNHTHEVWEKQYLRGVKDGRVNFVPIDFLKQSPVPSDVFYLRQVIHNWSDDDCVTILKNIRTSMGPHSRLLIHDIVLLPNIVKEGPASFDKAPEPLLPNFGAGSSRPFMQDVEMMILLNGGERTLDELKALGSRAGLKFTKFYDLLETGLVEFGVAT